MTTLTGTTQRLELNQSSRSPTLEMLSEEKLILWQGLAARLECALFNDTPDSTSFVSDLSNVDAVNIVVRKNTSNGDILFTTEVTSVNPCSYSAWTAQTSAPFVFELTELDTTQIIPQSGRLIIYFVVTVTTTDNVPYIAGFGFGYIQDVGYVENPVSSDYVLGRTPIVGGKLLDDLDADGNRINNLGHSGLEYIEEGSTTLVQGDYEVTVPLAEKISLDYRFDYLYIEDPNTPPEDIRVVVNQRTTVDFTVQLSSAPSTGLSILRWKVVVPDSVADAVPALTAPRYVLAVDITRIDVRKFGVINDGVLRADASDKLKTAMEESALIGQELNFPNGIYLVDDPISANLQADLHIYAAPGAVIKGAADRTEGVIDIEGGNYRPKVYMSGHGTIDNSLRENISNESSGTALGMIRLSGFYCDGWTFKSALGFGDSGIAAVQVTNFVVKHANFLYQSDLGIYLSGQTDEFLLLDRDAIIDGCNFLGCGMAAASKRRYRHVSFINNHVNSCGFGFALWEADTAPDVTPAGRDAIVIGNFFDKIDNNPIEFRSSLYGGVIADNVCTDWGWVLIAAPLVIGRTYLIADFNTGDSFTNVGAGSNATNVIFVATGTTPSVWSNGSEIREISPYTAALFLSGCRNVAVHDNTFAMKEWNPGTSHFGMWLRDWEVEETPGTVNYISQKNRIHDNVFRNVQTGIVSGQTTVGSDFAHNTFDNVVQRYSPIALDSIVDDEWVTSNPSATPQFGDFTSITTTGEFQRSGRNLRYRFSVHIIENGTGGTPTPPSTDGGGIYISLPFEASDLRWLVKGTDTYYPKVLAGILTDTTTMYFKNGDGTYPGHDGAMLDGEIYYELA